MRTFRWNAPIIIGAGALAFSVFAPAPFPLKAGEIGADRPIAAESRQLSLGQLKVYQEVITMLVFMGFSVTYMKKPLSLDLLYATLCLMGAAYFAFRSGSGEG